MVDLERQLDAGFAGGAITDAALQDLLARIAATGRDLRYAPLKAHLTTSSILTPAQIALYHRLRGYDDGAETVRDAPGHRHGKHR